MALQGCKNLLEFLVGQDLTAFDMVEPRILVSGVSTS
jgi:hypothetical protein